MTAQLSLVSGAVGYLAGLDGQDNGLVIEMAQAMIGDVADGGLRPLADYVRHYCDVIDGADDAERIAAAVHGED